VYMDIQVYTCMYIYTHLHVYMCVRVYIHTHIYMCVCIYIHTYTCIHTAIVDVSTTAELSTVQVGKKKILSTAQSWQRCSKMPMSWNVCVTNSLAWTQYFASWQRCFSATVLRARAHTHTHTYASVSVRVHIYACGRWQPCCACTHSLAHTHAHTSSNIVERL